MNVSSARYAGGNMSGNVAGTGCMIGTLREEIVFCRYIQKMPACPAWKSGDGEEHQRL